MMQKGPGEGYHAARDRALRLAPDACCKLSWDGGVRHYRIQRGGRDMACAATSAREAWNRFVDRLEAAERARSRPDRTSGMT